MIRLYKVFKYITISLIILLCSIYSGAYLLLSIPAMQEKVRRIGIKELSHLLNTPVSIEKIGIEPFDKIALYGVYLTDEKGDTLLYAKKLMAGLELYPLLHKKLVFTTAHLLDFDLHISKKDPESPYNFQYIIDAFTSKKKNTNNPTIDVQINTVVIRRGNITYDILSEPHKETGKFDKNHIRLHDFLSTMSLKSLRKDSLNINVRRISFAEQSGFKLSKLAFKLAANKNEAHFSEFKLNLPLTEVVLSTASADFSKSKHLSDFCDSTYLKLGISHANITLHDLTAFVPAFRYFGTPIDFSCHVEGPVNNLKLNHLAIAYGNDDIYIKGDGVLKEIIKKDSAYIAAQISASKATPDGIQSILNNFSSVDKKPSDILNRLGIIHFDGKVSGILTQLTTQGTIKTGQGDIHGDMTISRNPIQHFFIYQGNIKTEDFNLHGLFRDKNPWGKISLNLDLNGLHASNRKPSGKLKGEIQKFDYNGYPYENIVLNGSYNGMRYDGTAGIDDPNGHLHMDGIIDLENKQPSFHFRAMGENIKPGKLKLSPKYPDSELSFIINADIHGDHPDNAEGTLSLDSLEFINNGERFFMKQFAINAHNEGVPQWITVHSDFFNGEVRGKYSFTTLKQSLSEILSSVIPSIIQPDHKTIDHQNDFNFQFNLSGTENISRIFELPVSFPDGAVLEGFYNDEKQQFRVVSSSPKFNLKKTQLNNMQFFVEKNNFGINLSTNITHTNKKKKMITWSVNADAANDRLNSRLNWSNADKSTFCGELSTSTVFKPSINGKLPSMDIRINATDLILNDSIWKVQPSIVRIDSGRIAVSDFEIRHGKQFLHIEGTASKSPDDELSLLLNDLNLDYIFESLNINNVTFGGQATGDIRISDLLSGAPILNTRKFDVTNFSYNDAVLGDLHLFSQWENKNQGILLKGSVSQKGYPDTGIDGYIFPTKDSLNLMFDAQHLNLDFLQPFIGKILTNFTGNATGKINFFGKFNALNVTGKAYAEKIKFGVDYLNTVYELSDTVKLTTESISFDNVTIKDQNGHTAKAKGLLRHKHFKNLTYDIGLSDANNLLVFNVTELINPVYYGTIFGSGTASIKGDMARTNIDVNMRTNDHSKFTFVLSKEEEASDYQFITFVDRNQELRDKEKQDSTLIIPAQNATVKTQSHDVTVNLQIDATPAATMQIIMDPATNDIIKANGNGGIRIEYNTFSDMKIYGTYTLEKGSYSFNLQDIISRVFTIKSGSQISFRGNPLDADLNIDAIYSLSANLRDLSESFAEEKELSRTVVPVQTVLSVSGSLQQPDLKFNIEFPTLTQDIDRQVKSIISTDEMMNRQIIYLLAIGKFYTPDYMNVDQTRGNELVSVASSTLSSQLSNMLGQISDKWNIGTNIRSDKGDFSDVEFELALSSQLLNNRLIFNGNFGYRDNQVNSNAFIGDFDLEYLLSKSGNLRLKAYNHYNDQNYYIKSALTTQGVGIMFKRDFTRFSDLFYRITAKVQKLKRRKTENREKLDKTNLKDITPKENIVLEKD